MIKPDIHDKKFRIRDISLYVGLECSKNDFNKVLKIARNLEETLIGIKEENYKKFILLFPEEFLTPLAVHSYSEKQIGYLVGKYIFDLNLKI